MWKNLQPSREGSCYYSVLQLAGDGMEALRQLFPDGEANDLNAVLFSTSGVHGTFVMVFDDIRGTAALLDGAALVDGAQTSINFQSLRTRFPQYNVTYSRNDGSLSVSKTGGLGGILTGECRRIPPPQGAPQPR